ncbi:MAG TPA: efflux transporter outer membrane subunit [Steroidobacteraceae bacterium]|jgi:NodT family efflux transporter outer membrane factor (OMF) lipoprotein|nr:efflux transporter outer membrane subunit [Steroidobacteraceae bacterium]
MSRRSGAAVAVLASVLTGSCTLGPDFVRPAAPRTGYAKSAPAPSAARGVTLGGDAADDWYRLFESAELDRLVRSALAHNPDLEAARHGLLAAQYELRAVAGTALPQIDATGEIGRARINGSYLYSPVNTLQVTGNRFELGPALAYNLDLFGGTRRQIESQQAATAAVRDQVLNTYVTLVDQTVITAFDYAATLAQIEVTQALVDELESQYQLTLTLENAGKIIRSDTLQARAQLENLRATLPALEQQRDAYRNALAKLCGETPDEFTPPALSLRDFTLPAQLPLSLPATLVRQRPDVLAAEDTLHQASAAIGVAEAARLPALSLSAQYAQQTSALSDFLTHAGGIWSVGVNATAPLFHGGTLAARQHEAEERYRQARAAYRSTVIGAFVEVANALNALEHDAAGYAAHSEALAAAAADRDLALAQYRAGKYTELQVLTAEQQYQQAALTQVQADVQRFTDTAELLRALGGGWWNAPRDPAALAAASRQDPHGNSGEQHE